MVFSNRGSLDIEHRVGCRAGKGFQGDFVEIFAELGGNGFPRAADGGAGFALIQRGILQLGGFHGLDDLAQGDLVGGAGKQIATGGSAAGIDDSAAPEIIEDLN